MNGGSYKLASPSFFSVHPSTEMLLLVALVTLNQSIKLIFNKFQISLFLTHSLCFLLRFLLIFLLCIFFFFECLYVSI
jgi:hypothetical protein